MSLALSPVAQCVVHVGYLDTLGLNSLHWCTSANWLPRGEESQD